MFYYSQDFKDLEIVSEDSKEQKLIDKRLKTLEFHLSKCESVQAIVKIENQYIDSYNGDFARTGN